MKLDKKTAINLGMYTLLVIGGITTFNFIYVKAKERAAKKATVAIVPVTPAPEATV